MTSLASHDRVGPFGRIAGAIGSAYDRMKDTWRLQGELARMGDREVADLGVTRPELESLARAGSGRRRLMHAMMARVGVRPSDLKWVPGLMREVERTCGLCADSRRCRKWLSAPQPAGSHRGFCPNAGSFDEALRGRR
jgi:hypothetical protein